MNEYLIVGIGLFAQFLFSARLLVQWIASERAHKVLSPKLFWQLSMGASFLLCLYGWLRNDFAIILGQLISYYIYIWNLRVKGSWDVLPHIMRFVFISIPILAVLYFLSQWNETVIHLFKQEDIPLWLIVFGVIGQFTFTLRFIYQWLYSRKAGESVLPITFWVISLSGAAMIVSYALLRKDLVLIIGQSTGIIVYTRNIMIAYRAEVKDSHSSP
ncbi:lipid-A-disaccharide synthase N-terminal domain-containing protein [Bacteroides sp. 224]|uniref:lipid-A-disaccharide synthase N-terminal domain-containing protein n=1 Tax=Bacteroides sp. 224 TaxID=2302936 RepID=UPI0013D4FC04|nr:lipid-A-disaccharide synthase N-terminal domain-containing protein [Bacteroides sp. 224]NDV65848.1 lauroyl acyltransferase [Bacteroides sp. 224]